MVIDLSWLYTIGYMIPQAHFALSIVSPATETSRDERPGPQGRLLRFRGAHAPQSRAQGPRRASADAVVDDGHADEPRVARLHGLRARRRRRRDPQRSRDRGGRRRRQCCRGHAGGCRGRPWRAARQPAGGAGPRRCRARDARRRPPRSSRGANLAVISLPGAYAAREARRALERGLHVMLFSDNVRLEDEIALKKTARGRRACCVMGPDCGTAIINGMPALLRQRRAGADRSASSPRRAPACRK